MRRIFIFMVLCGVAGLGCRAQSALGHWRGCLDHTALYHVEVGGEVVYGASRGGLVRFDTGDRTLRGLSKVDGLSDVGVATIAHDGQTGCLVVAYTNSNLDIIDRGRTYNLSDIKRTELSTNKEVHAVRFGDGKAYVATGFGVVVVDLGRHEIAETWYLGDGGTHTAVYDLAFGPDSIYAATAGRGVICASRAEAHPAISDRWRPAGSVPQGATVTALAWHGGELLCVGHEGTALLRSLYRRGVPLRSGDISTVRTDGERMTMTMDGRVLLFDAEMNPTGEAESFGWGPLDAADAAIGADGTLWVASTWAGLVGLHTDGSDEMHQPASPVTADNVYRLRPYAERMMVCPGGHSAIFDNTYLPPNLYTAVGAEWRGLDLGNGMLDGTYDVVDAAVNPRDTAETVVALWGYGVASVRGGRVQTLYTDSNTDGALHPYVVGNYHSLRTGCVDFDRRGNLWVAVSNTDHALACRTREGVWRGLSTAALSSNLRVDKLVVDTVRGYLWFAGSDNAIFVHDGESRVARVNPNSGSKLQTESVNAIVQDHSGNIWIGTNKGIKVIYDGYNAFKNGGTGEVAPVSCNNITITNGEFSEYLMAYENITAIAVDGANRKWVGTATGGLYLLSANGMEQLHHFTTTNSPLYSDKIICIGIHSRSGEVFVGTDQGLQTYRGTATYATAEPQADIHAYPNPVRPGYEGPIAIKGFTRNALVRITDAAGNTVFSTQAYGGQAVWNGRTASGERVASGVYYVFASDADGGNRSVAKIVVVR